MVMHVALHPQLPMRYAKCDIFPFDIVPNFLHLFQQVEGVMAVLAALVDGEAELGIVEILTFSQDGMT